MSGFCDRCGVTNDLHNGPDSCDGAEAKVLVIEMFDRVAGIR